MKTINPTLHDQTNLNPTATTDKSTIHHIFQLNLDMNLNTIVAAIQCDSGPIKPAQKFSRPRLLRWIQKQITTKHQVHTVYECCSLSYTLHEELTAAKTQSLITTLMQLSPKGQRKNDRLDAHKLYIQLSHYLTDHTHKLRPIRIP